MDAEGFNGVAVGVVWLLPHSRYCLGYAIKSNSSGFDNPSASEAYVDLSTLDTHEGGEDLMRDEYWLSELLTEADGIAENVARESYDFSETLQYCYMEGYDGKENPYPDDETFTAEWEHGREMAGIE